MRPSLPARSSKARATAVMASTPPSPSYREPSTVPTSCALVTNGPATFPASHIAKPGNQRQVNLYLLLSTPLAADLPVWLVSNVVWSENRTSAGLAAAAGG